MTNNELNNLLLAVNSEQDIDSPHILFPADVLCSTTDGSRILISIKANSVYLNCLRADNTGNCPVELWVERKYFSRAVRSESLNINTTDKQQ